MTSRTEPDTIPTSSETGTAEISVRILLFSVLRERLGTSEIEFVIKSGSSTADLVSKLTEIYPKIRSYASVMRLAVNERYVDEDVELAEGDEVALITPVSGG